MKKRKFSATLVFCIILTIVALCCGICFDGTKGTAAWVLFWVFGVVSFMGYSCENAVNAPEEYTENS